MIGQILYGIGSFILFVAGLVSAFGGGFNKVTVTLACVSSIYAFANILLFIVVPNLK